MKSFNSYFYELTPSFVKFPFYAFRRDRFWTRQNQFQYFITNYANGKNGSYKSELKDKLDPIINPSWQWHHIIESGHLKPLFEEKIWSDIIEHCTPCVLVDKLEHQYFYSSLLHGVSVGANFDIKSTGHIGLTGEDRVVYIAKLRELYNKVYLNYGVLKTIANNFLDATHEEKAISNG